MGSGDLFYLFSIKEISYLTPTTVLQFFKRLFHLDPKDLETLYTEDPEEPRKKWLNKFYRELEIEKQAVLVISLFMLVKKQIYIGNNFSDYLASRVCTELYDLLIEKQPQGSMIIDINRMDNQWIHFKIWYKFHYNKADGYYPTEPLKVDEEWNVSTG